MVKKVMVFFGLFLACMVEVICHSEKGCTLCKCIDDKVYGGLKVVCSNLSLISVPDNINHSATTLLLDNNDVKHLLENGFQNLSNLRVLSVSNSQLQQIDENAFQGLRNLQVLNLEGNSLTLNSDTYLPNVFKPLKQLLLLDISRNSDNRNIVNTTYPDESFSHLTSLEEFHLDGLPCDFGPGFADLVHLRKLSLSENKNFCNITILRNTTFVNVPSLQDLNLKHCHIKSVEISTFAPLNNITSIDISDNQRLGFSGLANATYGLQNSPTEILKVNRLYPEHDVCTHLKMEYVASLSSTKLKELHMDENGIIDAEPAAIASIPDTLEIFSGRFNKFQLGSYIFTAIGATSLKAVDLSGMNKMRPWTFLKRSTKHVTFGNGSFIPVPPNLETLIVADCSIPGKVTPGGIQKPNSLKTIVAKKNFLSALYGPIFGLEKLEYLDFSSNIIEEIGGEYCREMTSIAHLDLSNNNLGIAVSQDERGDMFQYLKTTRTISLAQNSITKLPRNIFKGLTSIQNIDLSGNSLRSFDAIVSGSSSKSVNLAGNKIQVLTPHALKELEIFSTILLHDNPISCTCLGLKFLMWMNANEACISDLERITCELSPGKDVSFKHLDFIIAKLTNECNSGNILTISISLSLFLITMGIICNSVGYRHRWKLRYLYHVGRRAYRQHAVDNGDDNAYEYDVFVAYATPDRRFVIDAMMPELETKAGLRMCIHDRDFLPGEVIATNIVNAIGGAG